MEMENDEARHASERREERDRESEDIPECVICQLPLEEEDSATGSQNVAHASTFRLECGHRFHTACIMRWFRSNSHSVQCPVCRASPPQVVPVSADGGTAPQPSLEEDENSSMASFEISVHERDMNFLLKQHLCYARRKNCPLSIKVKARKYRESRENMIQKRRDLFKHDRYGNGRYVELRRASVRLQSKLVRAQSRFVHTAMNLFATSVEP